MFSAEDDDDSPKTPIVRPNDVLDIEVSPVARSFLLLPSASFEQRTPVLDYHSNLVRVAPPSSKQKLKKSSKGNNSAGLARKQAAESMKRGDPFLPSIFCDENPIADFTVKRNSRKKPSDCKCKGFGYNLSPSALLPEEMRQQWGVGVFGKYIPVKPFSGAASNGSIGSQGVPLPYSNDGESSRCSGIRGGSAGYSNTSTGYNSIGNTGSTNNNINTVNVFCPFRCMKCMQDPCLCSDIGQIQDGFRIPDYSDKRKQKPASKNINLKGKDMKSSTAGVIGSTFNSTPMKRSACFNSKDHSNIISTSNFPKNSPSPVHMPHPGILYHSEPMGISTGNPLGKSASGSKICPLICEPPILNKRNGFVKNEHLGLSRPNSLPPMSRRVIANISPAPIISTGSLDAAVPINFQAPKKHMAPRGLTPTRRIVSHDCACDSCRRRANLMSTMEALGLPASEPQQAMPPLLMTRPQRFSNPRAPSVPIASRYSPYRIPSLSYKSSLRDIYGSPESYGRSVSPYYDYGDSTGLGPPAFSSTPLPMNQDFSDLDTSTLYLDCDSSSLSPPPINSGPWMVEDITDLSVQETVDFFVNMKPPILMSIPSPQSDTSSDMFSPSPGEHGCPSPGLATGPSACFCSDSGSMGSWGGQKPFDRPYGRDNLLGFSDPSQAKFRSGESNASPYPPSSMLYSSLVSDLEDELRCAIENIPT